LGHCIGGPGTNAFGQFYGRNASNAADDNILTRIVEWVEHKKAPEVVRSTKFINDDPTKGVDYARNNCKYPKVNKYKGTGNGKDEAGWHCV
jgi:feruloyl esterase